ncbi:BUD4 [Candida pseudojiufengensis]|uniref:BUD4 n=1 Tax=Candida pseudojiufengensis TaxID=497109 RepID=UPI0022254556|nr:BUD4 [Candida pseudojiufengensis]KAI5958496.1 BUD4 [Candida pseudojiufengensis]
MDRLLQTELNTNYLSESVDLLLKEMNYDMENLNDDNETLKNNKDNQNISLSINNSPTKPLNFPNNQVKSTDPNSSSDTYTSEDPQMKTMESLKTSMDRNFDIDTSMELGKTISIPQSYVDNNGGDSPVDEFSFKTPMTSVIDLTNKHQQPQQNQEYEQQEQRNYTNLSPNKSILRKTPKASPKKVAFTSTNPEIHHYPDENFNREESQESETIPALSLQIPLQHHWTQPHLDQSEDESVASSPAPPPPPHTTKPTFAELLNQNKLNNNQDDDLDTETLTDLKLKHDNFSNLSLDEKMNKYLTNKTQSPLSSNQNEDIELDTHLIQLEQASKNKTIDNIHELSLSLQTSNFNIENPLDSLQKSPDQQLRSSGSSQSSLQSLRDTNRGLHSIPGSPTKANRGLELKDGIKGLPNSVVEALLPQDEPTENISSRPLSSSKENVNERFGSEDHMDSYDRSFNYTEQSILNLLNSASSSKVAVNKSTEQVQVKKEYEEEANEKEPIPEVKVLVKTENDSSLQPNLATKSSNFQPQQDKPEFASQVFKSEENIHVSAFTGLTPDEEIKRLKAEVQPEDNQVESEDDSRQQNEESRMSIRFQMDSDWKLEDSHDGDKEDNDEVSRILDKPEITKDSINSSQNDQYEDASNEVSQQLNDQPTQTLAPPKSQDEVHLSTNQPKEDSEALANSSNIAEPNEDITLPPVETNNYSSFDEVTKNLDTVSSFEQSLSAENDIDKNKMDNFISIWHSQEKQKRKQIHKVPTKQIIAAYQEEVNQRSNSVSTIQTKLPQSIKNHKKFKEVHVMSRRVVSPDFDHLQISGFLPELSRDSGFNDLQFSNYANSQRHLSSNSLNTKNVLSNIENYPNVIEPPQPKSYSEIRQNKTIPSSQQLERQGIDQYPRNPNNKRSRFRVPTFEIKRSSSILSPRNMYDDIFDDVINKKPPTIRAEGMKTLPSMDKDDVKRILSTRKGMTHDEYINAKFIEQKPKKNSIVTEAVDLYDKIQQTASIHDTNLDSPKSRQVSNTIGADVLPYLADELRKSPRTLLSKDQVFENEKVSSIPQSPIINSNINNTLPEPDFALDFSPENFQQEQSPEIDELEIQSNNKDPIFIDEKVSPKSEPKFQSVLPSTPIKEHDLTTRNTNSSPTKRSPIKIGSPVRLIKKDGSITGIESPGRNNNKDIYHHKPKPSFNGNEINNTKLRDIALENNSNLEDPNQHIPSTVSVPSEFSESRQDSNHHHKQHQHHKSEPKVIDDKVPNVQLQENGKLFFRVVGLKNINLPDMKSQKGKFSITLDNGVHCVKTPQYELNSNAIPIGKEFELTVSNSLQFILTMKCQYPKPKGTLVEVRERKVVKSKNKFARLFGSKDIITTTRYVPSEVKDIWANKFAIDGSFARCYVDFAQFEQQITGKVARFDLNCFNEWETNNSKQRLKPYKIAELEVEMLYIPKSEPNEILPTSIKSAYSSLQELNNELSVYNEGYLHQEGGDCEIWKKRWFKLYATSLIAHSEFNHKTRAKINLNKIIDVQYIDKENLNHLHQSKKTSGGNGGGRNFSDILLVEHSFKIKFGNGEIIIFGAPNYKEMKKWIEILENIIIRNKIRRQPWIKLMMKEQLINQQINQ